MRSPDTEEGHKVTSLFSRKGQKLANCFYRGHYHFDERESTLLFPSKGFMDVSLKGVPLEATALFGF